MLSSVLAAHTRYLTTQTLPACGTTQPQPFCHAQGWEQKAPQQQGCVAPCPAVFPGNEGAHLKGNPASVRWGEAAANSSYSSAEPASDEGKKFE